MPQLRNKVLLEKIAQTIKTVRMEHGITQETFFNDTSIHIGRIEQAKQNLTISTLEAICAYFDLSLLEFFKRMEKVQK